MEIWANTIVCNEERYIWYSIMSILPFVDKMVIWDTGSTDLTTTIVEEIISRYPGKVIYKEIGLVDASQFTFYRQKMLESSGGDWILLLDGDEVWWFDSITEVTSLIYREGTNLESIVVPFVNLVGDPFHHQDNSAGFYRIDNRIGNITIKAFRKNITGLHFGGLYGKEGLFDKAGKPLQERSSHKRRFINAPFMHFSYLIRSANIIYDRQTLLRKPKYKHEVGLPLPYDYFYPEVFFQNRPEMVSSPWVNQKMSYFIKSLIVTLPKVIRRKLKHLL